MLLQMLQYVLMPCFQQAFDSGKGEELIGSPAAPDQDNPDNVISVFINKVSLCIRHVCIIFNDLKNNFVNK